MLHSEYENQKNVQNQSEEFQVKGGEKSKQQIVTIKDVVMMLNNNQTIEQVADVLQMRVNVLISKLKNAAVIQTEDGCWRYIGTNESESLARNIATKIYVKACDREFVEENEVENDEVNLGQMDLDYELYKASLNIQAAVDKKSVLFEEGLYDELKKLSQKKNIKVSSLINVLIYKGLEHYQLK